MSTHLRSFVVPLLVAALLMGCATGAPRGPVSSERELAVRQQLLQEALGQIGRPYVYGGGDGEGFDCSGLVVHIYADAGYGLPRTAAQIKRHGTAIRRQQAQPGDLLFYRLGRGDHVVVYIGDGRAIHAPASGRTVEVITVDSPWWNQRLDRTVRILPTRL
jgi:cell wall-associated NlpC family hydrolase